MNAEDPNAQPIPDAWLAGVPPEEAADFQAVWDATGRVPEPGTLDPAAEERVWQALDTLIHTPPQAAPDRPRLRRVVGPRVWMGVAATLLIGAVGLALWLRPVTYTAAFGTRTTVALPDGSQAELNGGSALRYARRFGRVRAVQLTGEAFFDVVQDGRPFRVETFNAQVEVLGTRFNVKAWPGGKAPATIVTLESGRVALAGRARPEAAVEMAPGETRTVGPDDALSPPDSSSIRSALAWRSGELLYYDEQLGVVLEDLERRFGVTLMLQAPALSTRRVNLSIRHPDGAESVIRTLCAGYDLRYRATTTGFELYEPNSE